MPAESTAPTTAYRGRFAPSPTGPLHFGSLVAAVGSYLDARHHGGQWLLRIEDVDLPRCPPAADTALLHLLEAYGFEWDGEVLWQSRRTDHYRAALAGLQKRGAVFACACTRSELLRAATGRTACDGAPLYPGTCRTALPPGRTARAWRLRVTDVTLDFHDLLRGSVQQNLAHEVGDFVLLRADGLFAYQLAVVVDDAAQGITHVVRGADLLDSTPRQIWLQQRLDLPTPQYAHLPLVTNVRGEKLSKQTHAPALTADNARPMLLAALRFLGQQPPEMLADARLAELWQWARSHWTRTAIPRDNAPSPFPVPIDPTQGDRP